MPKKPCINKKSKASFVAKLEIKGVGLLIIVLLSVFLSLNGFIKDVSAQSSKENDISVEEDNVTEIMQSPASSMSPDSTSPTAVSSSKPRLSNESSSSISIESDNVVAKSENKMNYLPYLTVGVTALLILTVAICLYVFSKKSKKR